MSEPAHSPPRRALRVGLIGWGNASQVFHAPLITTTPGLALVAVSSSKPEVVRAALGAQLPGHVPLQAPVQVHADALELIRRDDLDLVVIPTPNATHYPLALAALTAGRSVVVDKPFTLDAAQAAHLVAEARQRGLLLSVFHNRRWDGDLLTAQALLRSGRLGRIVHAQLHFDRYRPVVQARWREDVNAGGGLWLDLAPHLLDQALQLFGRPVAIAADIVCARDGAQGNDLFHARLRWAGGLRADLHASTLAALPGPRFALHGTRGSWIKHGLDTQEAALKAGQRPDPARPDAWGADPSAGRLATLVRPDGTVGHDLIEQDWPNERGHYPAYYAGIRDALLGLAPNPVPAVQALDVMHLLDLGALSATERREIALPADTWAA